VKTERYKGRIIDARCWPLRVGGYSAWGMIRMPLGGEVILKSDVDGEFPVLGIFGSEDAAIKASVAEGQKIIDQK
jgi:hypothetical protein